MAGETCFGTIGRLEYDEGSDAFLCHVCGQWKRNLASHAMRAHNISPDEFRELAGLNRQTRLLVPSLRERLAVIGRPNIERARAAGKLPNWAEDPDKWRRDKANAVEAIREGIRAEGRYRRSAAFSTPEEHQQRAERRRQRNLAGLDRASPEAISAGIRQAAGERTCERCGKSYAATGTRQRYCTVCQPDVERERGRESARRRRLRAKFGDTAAPRRSSPSTRDTSRDAICRRCGVTFCAASHRETYCPPCRPVAAREYQRRWKASKRAGLAGHSSRDVHPRNLTGNEK